MKDIEDIKSLVATMRKNGEIPGDGGCFRYCSEKENKYVEYVYEDQKNIKTWVQFDVTCVSPFIIRILKEPKNAIQDIAFVPIHDTEEMIQRCFDFFSLFVRADVGMPNPTSAAPFTPPTAPAIPQKHGEDDEGRKMLEFFKRSAHHA